MKVIDPDKYDVEAIHQTVKALRCSIKYRNVDLAQVIGDDFQHGMEQLISLAEDVLGDLWGKDQK